MATTSYSGNIPPSSVQADNAAHNGRRGATGAADAHVFGARDMYLCPENIWFFLPVQSSRLMHFNSFDLQIYILLFWLNFHTCILETTLLS